MCVLDIVASDGWSTQVRVDVTGNYAPTVVIEAPADMETDKKSMQQLVAHLLLIWNQI